MHFYNFGSVGENEIDRIVSANSFSDMVIPQLDFVSDDRMVAYGDSEIAIFEGTQKPKLTQEIPLTGEAKSIFLIIINTWELYIATMMKI